MNSGGDSGVPKLLTGFMYADIPGFHPTLQQGLQKSRIWVFSYNHPPFPQFTVTQQVEVLRFPPRIWPRKCPLFAAPGFRTTEETPQNKERPQDDRMNVRFATLLTLALALGVGVARADIITASGEGWCNSAGVCNNTNTAALNNTFAGSQLQGSIYRDWFAFNLPNLGAPITGATISIWNDSGDITHNPAAIYDLIGASGISFGSLGTGPILGSDSVATADNRISHYENITLNAAGLALLNADQGSLVLFGGDVAGANTAQEIEIFGYTGGTPAALLTVETSAVPEPREFGLLLVTFLLVLVIHRKRQRQRLSASRIA